jgi:hypothetical protein
VNLLHVILGVALAVGAAPAPGDETRVVASSRLGEVTAEDLERFAARRGDGGSAGLDDRRRLLERLLVERAAVAEAERLALAATPEVAAQLTARREAILVAEMRSRLESAANVAGVDEAAVEAALARRVARSAGGERLRLRHLFKRLPANASPEERRTIEAAMQEMLAKLRAGADFAALARAHSDSQTAPFGGLIAPIAREDVDPSLVEVLWGLAPGESTGVVETPLGLHVFRLEERVSAPAIDSEPLREPVRRELEAAARQAALKSDFDALLRRSAAEFHPALLEGDLRPTASLSQRLFALGGAQVTGADLLEGWRRLSFGARRRTSLRSRLEEEAGRRLLLWDADRRGIEDEPEVAELLGEARCDVLVGAAFERRLEELAPCPPRDGFGRGRRVRRPTHPRRGGCAASSSGWRRSGRCTRSTTSSTWWRARSAPEPKTSPRRRGGCRRTRAASRTATSAGPRPRTSPPGRVSGWRRRSSRSPPARSARRCWWRSTTPGGCATSPRPT